MAKPKFDLISVGDTQLDVFLELEDETKVIRDPVENRDYLGLVFAEKIPAKKYTRIVAVGNSANVAIGCSRLGLKTAFYTHLGDDAVGKEEIAVFQQEGVAKDYIVWDKTHGSNFSAVLDYKGERTIVVHHEPRDYSLPNLTPARWMYFSSLAPQHEKLHTQIPEYVKKYGVKLAFNPGSYQLKEGLQVMKPVLEVCEVLFVNKEEAETLLGKAGSVEELARALRQRGPKIIVITDGPNGSYESNGAGLYYLPIFPAPLVERTGTGDSFASGFISALAHGFDVKEAMRWGTFNAAAKIQKIGAREGLLRKPEMEKLLKENPEFQPKEI